MRINKIGYNHYHDADLSIVRPYGSGDWVFLVLKTSAVFEFDGKPVVTEPDSFILFSEGVPQIYRAYGSEFANDWIHFDASKTDEIFFKELDIPINTPVKLDRTDELSFIISNMSHEFYSSNLYRTDTVELYFHLMFIKLSEKIHPQASGAQGNYHDKIHMLRSKIYNAPYEDWNVAGLAHELSMSVSYFQHMYKNTLGVNVKSDIINARMDHAKYLLTTTNMPIIKVAEMSGYKCGPHFMRQFKDHTGMTPSEYRELTSKEHFPKHEQ